MTSDADALVPARRRDLPALALVAGQAMGRRAFGPYLSWVLGVVGWPLWWMTLVLQRPHLWCVPRRSLVAIRPPDAARWPGVRPLLLGPGLVGSLMGLSWDLWRPLFWTLMVAVVVGVLVLAWPYPGRLLAGPKPLHPAPTVHVSMAATIRRGSGLLGRTRDIVQARHPDTLVELVARDDDLVALYAEHLGVTQVTPRRGRMVGMVPR